MAHVDPLVMNNMVSLLYMLTIAVYCVNIILFSWSSNAIFIVVFICCEVYHNYAYIFASVMDSSI